MCSKKVNDKKINNKKVKKEIDIDYNGEKMQQLIFESVKQQVIEKLLAELKLK
jgi:hypothetical protein